MSCNCPSARRLAEVEAELAQEQARRTASEKALREQARAVLALTEPAAEPAAEPVTAARDAVTPPVTAPSVTPPTREEQRRAKSAARSRTYRLRKRAEASVTPERDGVTGCVTRVGGKEDLVTHPPPSRVTPLPRDRGALAVVEVSAHSAREKRPLEPEQLPAEVQGLREAWQALAVPHGFEPWPARTPKRLLEDALRALERRPLEEWRKVFALVPRSPVGRGELPRQRGRKVELVRLLVGERDADGYEPAENLLLRNWSVDPEPQEAASARAAAPPEAPPLPAPPTDTREGWAWGRMLNQLREERRHYALQWLEALRPVALREGVLLLEVADRFQADWLAEHYGRLLLAVGASVGVTRVEYVLPGGAP